MSHVQTGYDPISFEVQINSCVQSVIENPSPRGYAMAIEALLRYCEYLELIAECPGCTSEEVIVKCEGQTIKFENTDDVADWMSDMMIGETHG